MTKRLSDLRLRNARPSLDGHIHDNPDRLTFGCTACLERVRDDQAEAEMQARLDEAPEAIVTFDYRATASVDGSVSIRVPVLDGDEDNDIIQRNLEEIDAAIMDELDGEYEWDWDGGISCIESFQ